MLEQIVATNLRHAMKRAEETIRSLAAKSNLGPSTIQTAIKASTSMRLNSLEAMSEVLGVEPWSMLIEDGVDNADLADLLAYWSEASEDGRLEILRTAAREARHSR